MINEKSTKIAIIGLGYVGLPLAVEFGKKCNSVLIGPGIGNREITRDAIIKIVKNSLISKFNLKDCCSYSTVWLVLVLAKYVTRVQIPVTAPFILDF